jgi:hypothetical protein
MPAPQYKSSDVELVIPRSEQPEERISWSSEKVEQLMLSMDEGYKPKGGTPFYENNPILRRGNILFDYTPHEIEEIKKCAADITYFADNYCTVMTDEGLATIVLRDYQHGMLNHFKDNRFSICLASRQIGKTICSSIYIAWYVLFNFDKNALVLSNKGATTREIIDKAKVILDNLPFFMKPGIVKNDVFNMKFDNGCRIIGQSTTKKAAIGFTIHLLFMDEFAHIHANFLDTFYENVYPTISSSKISRVIITSTPNGFNKFYEIYSNAIENKNEYRAFRVDWWQVPGRDEAWMKREVSNLGSEEAFNRQYGNQFIASSNLLLGPSSIKKLQSSQVEFVHHEMNELDDIEADYRSLEWHPDFDVESIREDNEYWVFSVDIAEGNGGDYSVINIFRVEPMDSRDYEKIKNPGSYLEFFRLQQVGVFRSNEHPIEEFSKILYTLAYDIFNPENVKMVIEWNMFGSVVITKMQTIFPSRNEFDEEMIVKFKHRNDAKILHFGLKLKRDNKAIFCQNFKKYITQGRISVTHKQTVHETISFGKTPSGSYEGMMGNDDLVMSSINVSEFLHTIDYSDFVEEKFDLIDRKIQDDMDEVLNKGKDEGNLYFDIYDLV